MKTVFLLRHAKPGDDRTAARDFDRTLNAKGHRAAVTIGHYMADEKLAFDRVLASPALRVKETLEAVAEGYGADLSPRFDRKLYLAPVDDLVEAARGTPDEAERLLLAGHNPGLEELVLHLVPESAEDGPRGAVAEKYPTASLAEIALDIEHWNEVGEGRGRLIRFVRPRDLDPTLGPNEA